MCDIQAARACTPRHSVRYVVLFRRLVRDHILLLHFTEWTRDPSTESLPLVCCPRTRHPEPWIHGLLGRCRRWKLGTVSGRETWVSQDKGTDTVVGRHQVRRCGCLSVARY